jgi:hypothetical protein
MMDEVKLHTPLYRNEQSQFTINRNLGEFVRTWWSKKYSSLAQNYWVYRLCLLFGILNTRKHNVSETGCFCPQVRGGATPTLLGLLERADLNH